MTEAEADSGEIRGARSITVITPCFNEEGNVAEVYERVRAEFSRLGRYRYEHIFIDNDSSDRTVSNLKLLAAVDPNVKIIVNARNFGHVRSPMHAILQARGDAIIGIVADLQDPPELIPDLLKNWEDGSAAVLCVKRSTEERGLMPAIRRRYYRFVEQLSSVPTYQDFTGFGLYDRKVIEAIRSFDDPYPYFRGMIAEIGLPHSRVLYDQPLRRRGKTKHNFYVLWDLAMLGVTNLSKIPLRVVTILGFFAAGGSFLVAVAYFFYKLLFWNSFSVGTAPLVIGLFFLGSIQLFALGIIGEYVGSIQTYVRKRPYVIERERVNFEFAPGVPRKGSANVAL